MSGRRYAAAEWLDFLCEPGTPSQALRKQAARLERAATAGMLATFPNAGGMVTVAELAYGAVNDATGAGGTGLAELRAECSLPEYPDLSAVVLDYVPPRAPPAWGPPRPGYTSWGWYPASVRDLATRLDSEISLCRARGEYRAYRARGLSPSEARARVAG